MSQPQDILAYLRACYEADNRQFGILNLFQSSIRHLKFIEGSENLLAGYVNELTLDFPNLAKLHAEAQLQRREKTLYYCAFPIIGTMPEWGPRKQPARVCAPLLTYPAMLTERDGGVRLSINTDAQTLNVPVLDELIQAYGEVDAVDDVLSAAPKEVFRPDNMYQWIDWLEQSLQRMDAHELLQFPELIDGSKIKELVEGQSLSSKTLRCLPACGLALVPNSPNTRGVLYELQALEETATLSPPLQSLLATASQDAQDAQDSKQHVQRSSCHVPVVLSQAQSNALGNAATQALSMVIGPPGTGKSFTIAAAAIDHIARGESVLIACRKTQAVDVIANQIQGILGPNQCVIRGGESRHVRDLKQFLENLLHGIRKRLLLDIEVEDEAAIDRALLELDRWLDKRTRILERMIQNEFLWGQLTHEPTEGYFSGLISKWKLWRLDGQLSKADPLVEVFDEFDTQLQASNKRKLELLKLRIERRVQASLKENRDSLKRFLGSIRSRSSGRQERLFAELDSNVLLSTFPVWLTTVDDVSELVPLSAELFDVAIFDEATQCDMASSLPILQRAKRAMVVGDPKQLRHVSFLSKARQADLLCEFGLQSFEEGRLDYREKSLLDLASDGIASQGNVQFLNEHFRSTPAIIRFSNERFYGSALSVMRKNPRTVAQQSLFSRHVTDGQKVGGANLAEARQVVQDVVARIDSQQSLEDFACESIGILSPFRDQVDTIFKMVQQQIPVRDIQRHNLRIGTAHAFQGDERDVMYLSWVLDSDSHHSSIRFLNQSNLFNVSVTRARHQQISFHSLQANDLPVDSLLRAYLEESQDWEKRNDDRDEIRDNALRDIAQAFQQAGCQVRSDYRLAGVAIDLLLECDDQILGVDVIGCPGDHGSAIDLERYQILARAGLRLLPLSYRTWLADPVTCIAAIAQRKGQSPS